MSGELVWVDYEMAGLDLERDMLIEVATPVTDRDLNVLGKGIDVLTKPTNKQLARMSDFACEMYTKSGLLGALASGTTMEEATRTVLDYAREFVPTARRTPLAGNTIGTDRAFLARGMPKLGAHIHYHNVDISSLRELA